MGSQTGNFIPANLKVTFFYNKQCTNQSLFYFTSGDKVYWCSGRTTAFILSGTILKSLLAGILMSEIVMRKLALKICMIP